jgi:hypothetical protein
MGPELTSVSLRMAVFGFLPLVGVTIVVRVILGRGDCAVAEHGRPDGSVGPGRLHRVKGPNLYRDTPEQMSLSRVPELPT